MLSYFDVLKLKIKWILPPLVERILRQRLIHFIPHDLKRNIQLNVAYKNIHRGQKCFILATGPSINRQDLSRLSNEICISVGQFFLHETSGVIRPKYHVDTPIHPPYGDEYIAALLGGISKVYQHPHKIFLGHSFFNKSYYNYFHRKGVGIPGNISFINYAGANQLNQYDLSRRDLWNITETMFTPRTVVYMAIQVAVYMGFNKIYLIGCDQDYLMRYFNSTLAEPHFYKDLESIGRQSSDYILRFTLENWFEEYYYRWKQFRLMRQSLSQRGQEIYNATEGGMLDVFERKTLDEALKPS